jgi:lysophospholipase L1-like esterase
MNPKFEVIWDIIQKDYILKVKHFKLYPKKVDNLLVGDSLVAYYKPTIDIHKQGIAGDTTEGLLKRLDAIHLWEPKRVFIHIGTNDIVFTNDENEVIVNRILEIIKALKNYQVYVILPLPIDADYFEIKDQPRTNLRVFELKESIKKRIPFHQQIDMYDAFLCKDVLCKAYHKDGLHLNPLGYDIYEQFLNEILRKDVS